MKTPILVTGLSGLVGTRIAQLLQDKYDFADLSLATGIDITNFDQTEREINKSPANIILHMAAKTDVDACEDDKILGEDGLAWVINVTGTENIVNIAKKTGKKVIYISTDFVFDGTSEFYTEKDIPNPVNWYGCTKYEGEKLVLGGSSNATILRIAYPYRSHFAEKKDFARRILEKLQKKEKILALTDHVITPTFIDDIAKAIDLFLEKELPGIYHLVGSQSLTVLEAVKLIAQNFGFTPIIEPVTRAIYFKNGAFRPFKLALKNDKISRLGIKINTFESGLLEFKKQLERKN
ncbi:hypothetical protein A2960_00555 [Candidatus Gottesmanbacteria bacterium RIFCSPLOWO2_01_FULL_39_12b]|uniref:dTDP-4-dehydrorhamnose reductase n=1 Tax=Candidatus Gottesmanbacteria bacterium RIFCSPLOWO2_01_FULL_39_12b TaxID=1798388 RepID=A0A1F6APQ7_9BACT|nr:MAG: hypothetical protein A2960_00555 [Candidatus Gottesmanbacteria bacterium RIFCSPLOWO2_01_FULL_39_12b]